MRPRPAIRRDINALIRRTRRDLPFPCQVKMVGERNRKVKLALTFGPGPNGYGPGSDIFWWPLI